MKLYVQRLDHRLSTPVAAGDEEDCYTARGRRKGVFLTEEQPRGKAVECCDVDGAVVAEFEVTGDSDEYRSFVVPGTVTKELSFT